MTPRDSGGLGAGTAPSVRFFNLIDGDRFLLGNQLDLELSRVRQIEPAIGGADGKPKRKQSPVVRARVIKWDEHHFWPCD